MTTYRDPFTLEEAMTEIRHLRKQVESMRAPASIERTKVPSEPDAWVPIHPKQGPLWSMTTAKPDPNRLPQSYPIKPVYFGAANEAKPVAWMWRSWIGSPWYYGPNKYETSPEFMSVYPDFEQMPLYARSTEPKR